MKETVKFSDLSIGDKYQDQHGNVCVKLTNNVFSQEEPYNIFILEIDGDKPHLSYEDLDALVYKE